MPCLNESETLAKCISKANDFLKSTNTNGEVLIADNGSTDGSQKIASDLGARVIPIPIKGYGSALIGGIKAAKGEYIIMGDSDDSYDFSSLSNYIDKLDQGYDLVMGNRFKGGIKKGAMPFLHRYLGNPVLSFLGRLFFSSNIRDFHCGLRGFTKNAAEKMNLRCTGMEFASEMVVKATLLKLKIGEVPTVLSKDGRSRPPHLKTWSDGWRHLRFLLLFSPKWLFLYPGVMMFTFGLLFSGLIVYAPLHLFGLVLDVNTLLYTALLILIGFQCISFSAFTKIFAIQNGLMPASNTVSKLFKIFNLETGIIIGLIFSIIGIGLSFFAFNKWNESNFGGLDVSYIMRLIIPGSVSIFLGIQIILNSFFFSVLGLNKN